MKTYLLAGLSAGALIALGLPALAADAPHGQELFRGQCGFCHTAGDGDGAGGAGPDLKGVLGRKIGGDAAFGGYTPALSGAKDNWNATNLDAFLADPNKDKPGTAMPINVKDAADRADIIAYLASLQGAK